MNPQSHRIFYQYESIEFSYDTRSIFLPLNILEENTYTNCFASSERYILPQVHPTNASHCSPWWEEVLERTHSEKRGANVCRTREDSIGA